MWGVSALLCIDLLNAGPKDLVGGFELCERESGFGGILGAKGGEKRLPRFGSVRGIGEQAGQEQIAFEEQTSGIVGRGVGGDGLLEFSLGGGNVFRPEEMGSQKPVGFPYLVGRT